MTEQQPPRRRIVRLYPHRVWMILTYYRRTRENWTKGCGCSFRATPYGWLHIECLNHYLD